MIMIITTNNKQSDSCNSYANNIIWFLLTKVVLGWVWKY